MSQYNKNNGYLYAMTVIILSILSCATTEGYNRILRTWYGSNTDLLVEKWGYPTETITAPNGNTVYVYLNERSYQNSTYTTYNKYLKGYITSGGGTSYYWCKTYFEVDKHEKIIKIRWEGNDCTAY